MNFLLVGIDSLRADRLGCYGYGLDTSPTIDHLASAGALFERFYAPGVPTQPSFTTLFSGQFPTTHGIVAHGGNWHLGSDAPWLPEILSDSGYATAAVDNLADDHRPWFSRGFRDYINPRVRGTYPSSFEYNRAALEWFDARPDRPFFFFIHYWDPHTPYMPSADYRELFYQGDPTGTNRGSLDAFYRNPYRDWWVTDWLDVMAREWPGAAGDRISDVEFVRRQYDSEVRVADDGLKELLEALESQGALEDTALIVFGDHGESLGEHEIYFDHHGLYENNIHVPLVVLWPGGGSNRVSRVVQHTDIAPTILEGAHIPVPDRMEGRSFLADLRGEEVQAGDEILLTAECTWMAKYALRDGSRKLILARDQDFYGRPMKELYDLERDPLEETNLVEGHPDLVEKMEMKLERELADRLEWAGRAEDPVLAHGITLGKKMFPERFKEGS